MYPFAYDPSELCAINREFVLNEIHRQSLKRYWLAEVAGVHKTTLQRWLSGSIRQVRADHIVRLAEVLNQRPEQLIVQK